MKTMKNLPQKKQSAAMIAAKAVMLALTAVYPLFMTLMTAAGILVHSSSYGTANDRAYDSSHSGANDCTDGTARAGMNIRHNADFCASADRLIAERHDLRNGALLCDLSKNLCRRVFSLNFKHCISFPERPQKKHPCICRDA